MVWVYDPLPLTPLRRLAQAVLSGWVYALPIQAWEKGGRINT